MDSIMYDTESSSRSVDSTEESHDIPSPQTETAGYAVTSDTYGAYHLDKVIIPDLKIGDSQSGDKLILPASPPTSISLSQDGIHSLVSSTPKYKADGSWIKEDELLDSAKVVENNSDNVERNIITMDTGEDVLVLTGHDGHTESSTDTCVQESVENMDSKDSVSAKDTVETNPYVKESIPWNPGTVLKQTQDFEDKAHDAQGLGLNKSAQNNLVVLEGNNLQLTGAVITESSSDKHLKDSDSDQIVVESDKQSIKTATETYQIVPESEKSKDEKMTEATCDIDEDSVFTENSESQIDTEVQQTGATQPQHVSTSEGELVCSVYEKEDIPLQSGIVRKTRQEIEERNR